MNVYGRVTHPPYERHIVSKREHTGSDCGYIYVLAGRNIVGTVEHQTGGAFDTPLGIFRLFGPGGERYEEALTDYVTGKDGTLWMLNDPISKRAGWANGGGVGSPGGLEGDGVAFYSKFGSWGVDTMLVSNENCHGFNEVELTPAQIETDAKLEAYWHDRAKCDWDTYPVNLNQRAVWMSFLHYEFGTTSCGKSEGMHRSLTKIQAKAKAIMKAAQGGAEVPMPPKPEPTLPGGITLEQAIARFGKLTVHLPDGTTVKRGFNPKGQISLAWALRAATDKVWPEADQSWQFKDEGKIIEVITFKNSSNVLMRKSDRMAFHWV